MEFIEHIKKVIKSGILLESLMSIPTKGATKELINIEEKSMPRMLSQQHRLFLEIWNGADLDIIRVYGVGETEEFIKMLAREHKEWKDIIQELGDQVILFADDPAGFMYFETKDGSIIKLDTDGGKVEKISEDMNDFFLNYLFGRNAAEYAGEGWLQELKDANLI